MLVILQSTKKCGLSRLFFGIGAVKVGFLSQKHTFFGEKNVFSLFFEIKNFKNKGLFVNFLFDLNRPMLVLLQSTIKGGMTHLFF